MYLLNCKFCCVFLSIKLLMLSFCSRPNDLWLELDKKYKQNIKQVSQDPFEVAMYLLLGKMDDSPSTDMSVIIQHTEEYLWVKVCVLCVFSYTYVVYVG